MTDARSDVVNAVTKFRSRVTSVDGASFSCAVLGEGVLTTRLTLVVVGDVPK
jgi:hypothetical protein